MKKVLLLTTALYLSILGLYAQNLTLHNSTGAVNNGDTITYTSTDVHALMVSYMWVTNNSGSTIPVRSKKVILDTVPGSENYFCWTSCYLPDTYVGDTMMIKAGATNKAFSGDYDAMGHAGKSHIMYVFYNDDDPNDSIAYVAEYYAGSSTDISRASTLRAQALLFPNPASGRVNLKYRVEGRPASLTFTLSNILGSELRHMVLQETDGSISIDIHDLTGGVYFYSLKAGDRVLLTRKLVVRN